MTSPQQNKKVNGTTKVVAVLDRATFAQLLAAEKEALARMGDRGKSPGKKKDEKKKKEGSLRKRKGSLRVSATKNQ